jgi:hypothetical protein
MSSGDFGYRIACFRAYAKHSFSKALDMLDLILPFLSDEENRQLFSEIMRGIIWADSAALLYLWFASDKARALSVRYQDGFSTLVEVLRDNVLPWRPTELKGDPYAVLLAAELAAGTWPFVAEELIFIAKVVRHPSLRENPALVQRCLRRIWDATQPLCPLWTEGHTFMGSYGEVPPWLGPLEFSSRLVTGFRLEILADGRRELRGQVLVVHDPVLFSVLSLASRALYQAESVRDKENEVADIEEEFESLVFRGSGVSLDIEAQL